jgi:hypothetical protein
MSDDKQTPEYNEILAMAIERKTRREALSARMKSAANTLRPANLAARITDEQKQKVKDAAKKVGDAASEHKVAIGAAAAVTVAAGVAGALYLRNRKQNEADAASAAADIAPDGFADDTPGDQG